MVHEPFGAMSMCSNLCTPHTINPAHCLPYSVRVRSLGASPFTGIQTNEYVLFFVSWRPSLTSAGIRDIGLSMHLLLFPYKHSSIVSCAWPTYIVQMNISASSSLASGPGPSNGLFNTATG